MLKSLPASAVSSFKRNPVRYGFHTLIFIFAMASLFCAALSSNYDGPAELPRVIVHSSMANTPAPGSILSVNAGDDLQSALNNAQCGDTSSFRLAGLSR